MNTLDQLEEKASKIYDIFKNMPNNSERAAHYAKWAKITREINAIYG